MIQELENQVTRIEHEIKQFFYNAVKEEADLTKFKEYISHLDQISKNVLVSPSVIVLLDVKNFKILYINDVFQQVFGYRIKELKMSECLYLKFLIPEHLVLLKKVLKEAQKIRSTIPMQHRAKLETTLVGLRYQHAEGNQWVSFKKIINLSVDSAGAPNVVLLLINDITHLYHADFVWLRSKYKHAPDPTHFYHTGFGKSFNHDIISERELEVLSMLARRESSGKIAAHLGISINTVSNHRKNMMDRIGVSDTTSLLQLAQWCGIVLNNGYL